MVSVIVSIIGWNHNFILNFIYHFFFFFFFMPPPPLPFGILPVLFLIRVSKISLRLASTLLFISTSLMAPFSSIISKRMFAASSLIGLNLKSYFLMIRLFFIIEDKIRMMLPSSEVSSSPMILATFSSSFSSFSSYYYFSESFFPKFYRLPEWGRSSFYAGTGIVSFTLLMFPSSF